MGVRSKRGVSERSRPIATRRIRRRPQISADEVILPEDTRPRLCRALQMLRTKRAEVPRRKHGNIPL